MKHNTKLGLLAVGTVAVTALVTHAIVKRAMVRRCGDQVRDNCMDLPLTTESFCDGQAAKVCEA